jgi:WD40 repeat protein
LDNELDDVSEKEIVVKKTIAWTLGTDTFIQQMQGIPDGVVCLNRSNAIVYINGSDGKLVQLPNYHQGKAQVLAADSRAMYTGDAYGYLCVWNLTNIPMGKPRDLSVSKDGVLAIASDGVHLVVSSRNKEVRIYDADTLELKSSVTALSKSVKHIYFIEGAILGVSEQEILKFDGCNPPHVLMRFDQSYVSSSAVCGDHVVVSTYDRFLSHYQISDGQATLLCRTEADAVFDRLVVSGADVIGVCDGKLSVYTLGPHITVFQVGVGGIITGDKNGYVNLLSLSGGEPKTLYRHDGPVTNVVIHNGAMYSSATCDSNSVVKLI